MIDNNEPSSLRYPLIKTKKEQILEGKGEDCVTYILYVRSMHWNRKSE